MSTANNCALTDAMRRDKRTRKNAPRPEAKSIAPHLAAAHDILEWLAEEHLAEGDHAFADIRREFLEICARPRLNVAPVTDRMIAAWLTALGFAKRRVGRAKTTTYSRVRRDSAARAAA
jgi:hypothetical protein